MTSAADLDSQTPPPRVSIPPCSAKNYRAPGTPVSPLPFERSHSLTRHLSSASPLLSPCTRRVLSLGGHPPTLRTSPFLTLRFFCVYVGRHTAACTHSMLVHPVTAILMYPTLAAYVFAKLLLPPHAAVHEFEVRSHAYPLSTFSFVVCVTCKTVLHQKSAICLFLRKKPSTAKAYWTNTKADIYVDWKSTHRQKCAWHLGGIRALVDAPRHPLLHRPWQRPPLAVPWRNSTKGTRSCAD
jgi:hypothetical protein